MSNKQTIARLRKLSRELESLPKARHRISVRVAKEYLALIRQNFAAERDPYGKRQLPKQRDDGCKVLHGPTGRLRRFTVRFNGNNGFTLIPGADYFVYQQPARHMLPVDGQMPRKWERILFAVSREELRKHLR